MDKNLGFAVPSELYRSLFASLDSKLISHHATQEPSDSTRITSEYAAVHLQHKAVVLTTVVQRYPAAERASRGHHSTACIRAETKHPRAGLVIWFLSSLPRA